MPPFSPFSNLCPLTNNTSRNSSRDMIENSSEDTSTLGTSILLDKINNSTQDSKENPPPHNQHIDWSSQHYTNSCKKKLEHSFSDVSQFDINVTANPIKPKPLRADFLHLAGVALHSRRSKNSVSDYLHNHIGEKDGFAFRSIQRSISCISKNSRDDSTKTIVVVPSLDLDTKELKRMCDCIECYEDRQLFYLLMAKDPSVRIIYLTSNDVNESVVHDAIDVLYSQGLLSYDDGDEMLIDPGYLHLAPVSYLFDSDSNSDSHIYFAKIIEDALDGVLPGEPRL